MKRLALWLLRRTLRDRAEFEMVAGDLDEAGRGRSEVWYLRQAIAIARHAVLRRNPAVRSRGVSYVRTTATDLRIAARALSKRPALTLAIAATLGLGLGANAAIFNLIDRLILRPFPFPDPDRVVMLAEAGPGLEYRKGSVSPANFHDWRQRADAIDALTASTWWDANLTDRGNPERIQGAQVTSGFFDAVRVRPALGRGFVNDDETFGRDHVVVISDQLWERRFGRDPGVLGRRMLVDGVPYDVIGVMPARFAFPDGAAIWAPLAFDPAKPLSRTNRYLTVIGRLAPGRALEQAAAQMNAIATELAKEYPDADRDHGVQTMTLARGMMDVGIGPIMALWQASAFIVLLIACANIASLLLARASERKREIGVRLALGASRGRILRELLTESLVLAVAAVPAAIGFSWLFLWAMRAAMPADIVRFVPGWESLGPDFRMLWFTLMLAASAAVLFGSLPALQATRCRVAETLKDGGRTATGRHLLRRAVIMAEIAIALPLLVAAGRGVIGTNRFLNGPQGYNPDGVLTMKLVLPQRTYGDDAARRDFADRALDSLDAVAGVERTAVVNLPPAVGSNTSRSIEIDGHPYRDAQNPPSVDDRLVSAGYFETLQIPIVRGRGLSPADREHAQPVAVVSDAMARRFWPGEDPIGRRVRVTGGAWLTVVGICGDVIQDWYAGRNNPTLYRPFAQAPSDYFSVVVRADANPAGLAGPIREALLRVDPSQPVFDMKTMRQQLKERTIGLQYLSGVISVFAMISLLLAAVGLYAVMAYMLSQRRQEIGIRMALGATGHEVLRLAVGGALKIAVPGAALGGAISLAVNRVTEAAMLGIAGSAGGVLAGFAAILVLTALAAAYLPARRAASMDPNSALRTNS